MAAYRVLFRASARKELDAIGDAKVRGLVFDRTCAPEHDPRPPGCEKLSGTDHRYRVRQGDYRIIYEVDDVVRIVAVVKVGHRRDVYR